jgi:hypothetical protein
MTILSEILAETLFMELVSIVMLVSSNLLPSKTQPSMTCKILYIVHLGLVDFPAFHEKWTMAESRNKIS